MSSTGRGAPYPDDTAANNAPADLQALAQWVSDRPGIALLSTAQRNALSGVELWADRLIFNTTTQRLEKYSGPGLWRPLAAPGRLLGSRQVTGPQVVAYTVASTGSPVALAGHDVAFTAPASGSVWVDLEAIASFKTPSSGQGAAGLWVLRDGAAVVATVAPFYSAGHDLARVRARVRRDGLTADTTYTWQWVLQCTPDGAGNTSQSAVIVGPDLPSSMTVTEA